ncbi:telomeric repeat-binding factor 1 isoform X2 [Echeneis naucrates]|uniref:Telomeric repeat-binding factor n=1 Tax=Echeneis naucrates TaxID=173247 RepID=A0A665VMR1_ECHNA|nr:telomeric repeat-binding factor 1 isoform X2 [Echeneis naucrates]
MEVRKSSEDGDKVDRSVISPRVTAVSAGWMLDFMFVSLCRRFEERQFDQFNEALSVFEAICVHLRPESEKYEEKIMISAFLARVMHGKQLDVQFEQEEEVMPLMSATKIWSKLEDTVADKSVFKNVATLLIVQCVTLCLENGEHSCASSAIKWFENNQSLPQNLRVKLTTVVTKRDTYHPFLRSFSFSRLLETIQSYLDSYLERNPSDYLLKAATEMALSSRSTEELKDDETQEHTEEANTESPEKEHKTKRKLLSTKMTDLWNPESCKKPCVSLKRLSKNAFSELKCEKSKGTTEIQKKRKPPQKWTSQLDSYLKAGVRRHGLGKWSRILQDYDFEGRTGTMLKDRWRVLLKAHEVS